MENYFPEFGYINVPALVNGIPFTTYIAGLETCLATKGNEYLQKISGGIQCSNIELLKLELSLYLLKRFTYYSLYNGNTGEINNFTAAGISCIYNGSSIPGISYGIDMTGQGKIIKNSAIGTEIYLKTFTQFASKFCKDCLTTGVIYAGGTATATPTVGNYLLLESDLTPILLEDNQQINLE